MSRARRGVACALALAGTLAGCSTTTRIVTRPTGAHLWLREQYLGRAPVEVALPNGLLPAHRFFVRAELEGHAANVQLLRQDVAAGWIVLDTLLVLGTFGLAAPIYVTNATVHRGEYLLELTPQAPSERAGPSSSSSLLPPPPP